MYRFEKEKWTDEHGKFLCKEDINLNNVSDKIIKKRTIDRKCSYVELVANEPQQSNWFVSYPWSTPLIDLIYCLKQHCRDHELSEFTTFYCIIVSSYSISFYLIIKYLLSIYIYIFIYINDIFCRIFQRTGMRIRNMTMNSLCPFVTVHYGLLTDLA